MSEYELVDAFLHHVEVIMVFLMSFLSATSAFLIVAHLAAAAIPPLLAKIAITVYTLASIVLIFSCQRITSIAIEVRDQMQGSVPWHTAVLEPQWVIPAVQWILVFVMIGVYGSSIWYFKYARQHEKSRT